MSQHTPGPWHRNIRANGKYPVVFAGRNQHVATTSQQTDPAETEGNIDLIAAAPDLLNALQICESVLRIKGYVNAAEIASIAIAKATGEQQ